MAGQGRPVRPASRGGADFIIIEQPKNASGRLGAVRARVDRVLAGERNCSGLSVTQGRERQRQTLDAQVTVPEFAISR
jgi:hypothetical protein